MTMTAIRINNVIINTESRAKARDLAKESGGKIVDRGTFAAKRWGVLVNRIHCMNRDNLQIISRNLCRASRQTKILTQSNGKKIRVMTKKAAMQFSMIPRVGKDNAA